MANRKINELSPRTPSLTDLIIVGDPSTGYSYRATISVLAAFAGSNIQFSSLNGVSITSPTTGQYLTYNGTNWVNTTLSTTTWDTAYNRSLTAAAVTGTTTKTLTLTKQDGSTLTASWSDLNTDAVTSVFGRTGAVVAAEGDYTLDQLGGVTITTPSTNQVLQYNGTAWVNATFVAGVSGSGTTNYLPKWTSSTALGNSLIFDNGTSVGINTATPSASYLLDVNGSVRTPNNLFIGTDVSGAAGGAYTLGFGISSTTHISGERTIDVLSYYSSLKLRTTSGVNFSIFSHSPGGYTYLGMTSNHPLLFYTNNTERMRITASGRVLINTTTESTYELDVVGDIRSTLDANINGLRIGKGGGSVATNTAVGISALNANTTAYSNTAIGNTAMAFVQNGYQNTSVGAESMTSLVGGIANVAVGFRALQGNTSSYQTAIGWNALSSSNSGYNTGIGYRAGLNVTTGAANIFLGYDSGHGITTGSNNVIIGNNVTGLSASLSNTIILADGQGNQRLYINSSGNVGIGTTSPNASALLDITSTTKGFLPPRMTGAQAEAIATPAAGLMVYANNGNGTTITSTGWWGYNGSGWVKLN